MSILSIPPFRQICLEAFSETSNVTIHTTESIIPVLQRQRADQMDMYGRYIRGEAPIHVAADKLGRTLADMYHWDLLEHASNPEPLHQFPLLVRHGGCPWASDIPMEKPSWRLHLDITGLLLAAHADILAEVERTFKPLRVADEIVAELQALRDSAVKGDPGRLASCDAILALIARRRLRVATDTDAKDEIPDGATGGYAVDYLATMQATGDTSAGVTSTGSGVTMLTCGDLLEQLRLRDEVTGAVYEEARAILGPEADTIAAIGRLPDRTPLRCRSMVAETLHEAGLLERLCRDFNVSVEPREVAAARDIVAGGARTDESVAWLATLIGRIRRGVDEGVYERVSAPRGAEHDPNDADTPDGDGRSGVETLLGVRWQPGDALWIDDRFMMGYQYEGSSVPIIGIGDVLAALVGAGALARDAYYAKILALRAANVRFLPIDGEEIAYHLGRARDVDDDGALRETGDLRTLRRYVAACLVQGGWLQMPPVPAIIANKGGEVLFPHHIEQAAARALADAWTNEGADDLRQARAEWVLRHLSLDLSGIRALVPGLHADADDLHLAADSLMRLLVGFIASTLSDAEAAARRRYGDWLDKRVLRDHFEREPDLLAAVADMFKGSFVRARDQSLAHGSTRFHAAIAIRDSLDDLPASVREAIESDARFMGQIGFDVADLLMEGGMLFERAAFWRAAARAVNDQEANITPVDGDRTIALRGCIGPRGGQAIRYVHPETGEDRIMETSELGLLRVVPDATRAAVRDQKQWIDCDRETLDELAARVATTAEPVARIDLLTPWWRTSVPLHYAALERRIVYRETVTFADAAPPQPDGMSRHLRLVTGVAACAGEEPDGDVAIDLEGAARRLIAEEGLTEATARLAGLPVALPAAIRDGIAALDPAQRRALIKSLLRSCVSPVARLHVLRILHDAHADTEAYRRLIAYLMHSLLGAAAMDRLRAFTAILRWLDWSYVHRTDTRGWEASTRLAVMWAHANEMFAVLMHNKVRAAALWDALAPVVSGAADGAFTWMRAQWFDIAHPRRVEAAPLSFLLAGLAYALGPDADDTIAEVAHDALATIEGVRSGDDAPMPRLILAPALAPNALGSFLGADIFDRPLPDTTGSALGAAALERIAMDAVRTVREAPDTAYAWIVLRAVLGDGPIPVGLMEDVRRSLLEFPLARLLLDDEKSGVAAAASVEVACLYARYSGNRQVLAHIEEEIVACAVEAARMDGPNGGMEAARRLAPVLLHVSERFASTRPTRAEALGAFARLLIRLVTDWRMIAPTVLLYVERMYRDVPVVERRHLAQLLTLLRLVR